MCANNAVGYFFFKTCTDCISANCCDEHDACIASLACRGCLRGNDASCDEGALDEALLDCESTYCPGIRETYRPQVEAAESYGRYYALLSHMVAELEDVHARILSATVCGTPQDERPPALIMDTELSAASIDACVTLTDDDSLVVYRVGSRNPAGLSPGDEIVGYDGVVWSELLDQIESWELPICGVSRAAASARHQALQESVIANDHLFDSLDVLRADGSQESIPTADLLQSSELFSWGPDETSTGLVCNHQLPVAQAEFPWSLWDDAPLGAGDVSSGRDPVTGVGYVYVYSYAPQEVEAPLTAAIEGLMDTDALIIDHRFNLGGMPDPAFPAIRLLFNEHLQSLMTYWQRVPHGGYDELQQYDWPELWDLQVDPATFYNRPIGLLTGPHSVSAGDIVPYILRKHPNARVFGRPTSGDFGWIWPNPPATLPPDDDITYIADCRIARSGAGDYLLGTEQEPDERVWLTREDVIAGKDTVVEAALVWIEQQNAP